MENKIYPIGNKNFKMKSDFTYAGLEWLDVVYVRLTPSNSPEGGENEIKGSFTREEIEKTISILLIDFTHEDFMNMTEGQSVKIIADFFLWKAIIGTALQSSSVN